MKRITCTAASRRSAWHALAVVSSFLTLLPLGACGGGGGGGGGGGEAGTLSGRVLLPEDAFVRRKAAVTALAEAEPNDRALRAQSLGALAAGDTLTVRGELVAADPLDVVRVTLPERVRLVATLAYAAAADVARDDDVDAAAYDPTTLSCVAFAAGADGQARLETVAKGLLDIALRAAGDAAAWTLTLRAEPLPTPLALPGAPLAAGEWLPGDALEVAGEGPAALDVSLPLGGRLLVEGEASVSVATLLGTTVVGDGRPALVGVREGAGRLYVLGAPERGPWRLTLRALGAREDVPAAAAAAGVLRPALRPEAAWQRPLAPEQGYAFVGDTLRAGEALVLPHAGRAAEAFDALAEVGCRVLESIPDGASRVAFDLEQAVEPEARARGTLARTLALSRCAALVYAEPNHRRRALATPNDPRYGEQWHYPIMRLPEAWNVTTGSASVIVAIVDTGITAHPDLAGRSVAGYDFIADQANAADGNGRDGDPTDPGDGYDGEPASWHGTHVAGTVGAATNNGVGVAGVTWGCKLMPLRVLGPEGGDDFDIANAVLYAARLANVSGTLPAARAHVLNMSLGGGDSNATFADACARARDAGVVIVAAAGNESTSQLSYPAAFPGVIAVGAIDRDKALTSYSNYGSWVDCVAPGGDSSTSGGGVLSTLPNEAGTSYGYDWYDGTSMASPHAAGVAALVFSVAPTWTAAQVESTLLNTAQDLGASGRDNTYGYGLLDAFAAVTVAAGGTAPPPPPPPPGGGEEDPPPGDGDDTIWVLAVDADTDETLGESEVDLDSLTFRIGGLPPGSYVLYAGTDLDGDGWIGDEGDLLGAWPDWDDPEIIDLEDGAGRGNLRIPLHWADDLGTTRRRLGR